MCVHFQKDLIVLLAAAAVAVSAVVTAAAEARIVIPRPPQKFMLCWRHKGLCC